MKLIRLIILLVLISFLFPLSQVGVPEGISVVNDFNSEKFLGKWYQVVRIDNVRKRLRLVEASVTYVKNDDGSIKVINQGYNIKRKKWTSIEGKIYLADEPNVASLKANFVGPFYRSYNVIKLDPDYQVAMLTSYDKKYFWIFARTPDVDESQIEAYIQQAKEWGFATDKMVRVPHGVYQK